VGVLLLVVASLGYQPVNGVTRDRVDLVEVNHYYDELGRLVFDQVIYYDWSVKQSRFNVRAWRLVKKPAQIPHRNWNSEGGYVSVWHDGGILRRVHAKSLKESWTQYDPEMSERKYLTKDQRRDLSKVNVKLR
jgi:hypothetical protein